ARLSEDGSTVLLSRGGWSSSFPLSRLPSQIAFYRASACGAAPKRASPALRSPRRAETLRAITAAVSSAAACPRS
ncbi:hypothetical protein VB636_00875, partial [Paracoccus sp. APAP_BH8]|uniref:hypothetical protein n=1 Tax=Paracoccus sp. APAP_BH8 TaxID=3110237 RepID=UPI002FD86B62